MIVKITARTFMIADDKVNFVLLSRKRSIKDTRKSPKIAIVNQNSIHFPNAKPHNFQLFGGIFIVP